MSGNKRHINPLLLIFILLLCFSAVFFFRRSSFDPSYDSSQSPVAQLAQTFSSSRTPDADKNSNSRSELTPAAASDPTGTVTPAVSSAPTVLPDSDKEKISPEAASGVWTSNGSSWLFMTEGTPYTGWLIDSDGKHYYFNSDGIMQTGWIEDSGKRYYADLDGIMQTGTVTIDGKDYEFLSDGTLKE